MEKLNKSKGINWLLNIILILFISNHTLFASSTEKVHIGMLDSGAGNGLVTRNFTRDNYHNIVIDTSTSLQWQDNSDVTSIQKTWSEANSYCNTLLLAGYDDWRLPTSSELLTIVDLSKSTETIFDDFNNISSSNYWSSTEVVNATLNAWYISFLDGSLHFIKKEEGYNYNIRCVRGGDSFENNISNYLSKDGNSVTDTLSNLVWQDDEEVTTTTKTWSEAVNYCTNKGMKLPTRNELFSIEYLNNRNPAIYNTFSNIAKDAYWTSDTESNNAWIIHFNMGKMELNDISNSNFVRCVNDSNSTNDNNNGNNDSNDNNSTNDNNGNNDSNSSNIHLGMLDSGVGNGLVTRNFTRDDVNNIVTDTSTSLQWQDNSDVTSIQKTWSDANSYCNTLSLGGYDDWRLPSSSELLTIVDLSKSTETIFDYFNNISSSNYWSSTEVVNATLNAWYISFLDGSLHFTKKEGHNYNIRCVRGGDSFENDISNYLSKDGDSVKDTISGLIWQDDEEVTTTTKTWSDAVDYCTNKGMRLPTRNELYSIVNLNNRNPAIYNTFSHITQDTYWTSETESNNAWTVDFNMGKMELNDISNSNFVRCVNDGNVINIHLGMLDDGDESGLLPRKFISDGNSTVTDNLTSLQWQDNSDVTSIQKTWSDANSYCNTLSLNGYNDWRLPNASELLTIVDLSKSTNTIFNDFQKKSSSTYWTNQEVTNDTNDAWLVDFQNGSFKHNSKGSSNNIRCVRGGDYFGNDISNYLSRDIDSVKDSISGLIWQDDTKVTTTTKTWSDAVDYCTDKEMRLPTRNELFSIVNLNTNNPSVNDTFSNTNIGTYWTSTKIANDSEYAWSIDFDNSNIALSKTSNSNFVRCVADSTPITISSPSQNIVLSNGIMISKGVYNKNNLSLSVDGVEVSDSFYISAGTHTLTVIDSNRYSNVNLVETFEKKFNIMVTSDYATYYEKVHLGMLDNGDESGLIPRKFKRVENTLKDLSTSLQWQDVSKNASDKKTWSNAKNYCDTLSLNGFNDWRLPSSSELLTIVDTSKSTEAIFDDFNYTSSSIYWTSTTVANGTYAWSVNFNSGGKLYNYSKSKKYNLRCVRGGDYFENNISNYFVKNEDIVKDKLLGLIWQDDENITTTTKTWSEAVDYCTNKGMRLPTRNELLSIVNFNNSAPAIYDTFLNVSSDSYWTSETESNNAWSINFNIGQMTLDDISSNNFVRCVSDSINLSLSSINVTFSGGVIVSEGDYNKSNTSLTIDSQSVADNFYLSSGVHTVGIYGDIHVAENFFENSQKEKFNIYVTNYNNTHLGIISDGTGNGLVPHKFERINNIVTDTSTSLQWQDDSAVKIIRKWGDSYTYCEDLSKGGHDDWRLPTLKELLSIVDSSKSANVTFDIFKYTSSSVYWSEDFERLVNFKNGNVNFNAFEFGVIKEYRARCVRGGDSFKSELNNYFTRDSDIVKDDISGLTWQNDSEAKSNNLTWSEAIDYCQSKGMRLPTKNELYSIVSESNVSPKIYSKFLYKSAQKYWTSTPWAGNSTKAWIVDFSDGTANYNMDISSNNHVRCIKTKKYSADVVETNNIIDSSVVGADYIYNLSTLSDSDWSVSTGSTLPSWLLIKDYDNLVSTISGDGSSGSSNGTITNATFYNPKGVVVDSKGNIFVVDQDNHRIRKIATDGNVTTFAGGTQGDLNGQGTNARFNTPYGITIDSGDNLYVTDTQNHRIKKIDSNGYVTTIAGSSERGYKDSNGVSALFNNPRGIVIDSSGNLYVADGANYKIRKIDKNYDVTTFAGNSKGDADGDANSAQFKSLYGIAIDDANNLYIADRGNNKIRKVDSSGNVVTIAGSGEIGDKDANGVNAKFNAPQGIVYDKNGGLYVADTSSCKIKHIDSSYNVTTIAGYYNSEPGNVDGVGSNARFNFPVGIAIGNDGEVIVSNTLSHAIKQISTGTLLLGTPTSSEIGTHSVSLESNGEVYNFEITVSSGTSISGTAVDGYISGARVKFEKCDFSATTNNSGKFTLKNLTIKQVEAIKNGECGVAFAEGGTDMATGEPFLGILTAPAGSMTLSPLTSLVESLMSENSITLDEAINIVADKLGIDSNIVMEDFIAITNDNSRSLTDSDNGAMASKVATILSDGVETLAISVVDSNDSSYLNVYKESLKEIASQILSDRMSGETNSSISNLISKIDIDSIAKRIDIEDNETLVREKLSIAKDLTIELVAELEDINSSSFKESIESASKSAECLTSTIREEIANMNSKESREDILNIKGRAQDVMNSNLMIGGIHHIYNNMKSAIDKAPKGLPVNVKDFQHLTFSEDVVKDNSNIYGEFEKLGLTKNQITRLTKLLSESKEPLHIRLIDKLLNIVLNEDIKAGIITEEEKMTILEGGAPIMESFFNSQSSFRDNLQNGIDTNAVNGYEITQTLERGWNLVALPIHKEVSESELFNIYKNASMIWKYEGKEWSDANRDRNVDSMTFIQSGKALWVKNSIDESITFRGEIYTIHDIDTNNITSGWYLLGTGRESRASDIMETIPNVDEIWSYNGGEWKATAKSIIDREELANLQIKELQTINSGQGFWVKIQ